MKATRSRDTLRLTLTGQEIRAYLDEIAMQDAIVEALDGDEHLLGWALRPDAEITLVLDLDILAAPGQSEREIYRRENGVPLV
jgi:hypothetical protein